MQKNRHLTKAAKANKNPSGAAPSIVMTKIDVRPWNRTEQDIPSWRSANKHAEGLIPRRTKLYDLYADVELDGHVEAVTSKRRDAVTSANWKYVDENKKPVDQVNELISSIGFNDLLEDIVNSKFWGYSIFEPTFFQNWEGRWEMDANLLPRMNYRPELGLITEDYLTDNGINIREGYYAKTIMEVGNPNDLGLHLKGAPYAILKRGGLGDYAMFVQVFGNPLVDAEWDGYDESQRKSLLEAITSMGSGGALVRPAGTKVTLLENKSNANGDLQYKFISLLNKEISKTYLGSTETTESSSSSGYAQAKTHEDQDERKMESDLDFVRRILNSRFRKILATHGFPVGSGAFVIEGEENELSKKESFEIHKTLAKEINLPIEDDFWYQTYGVPKPDNYEELKRKQEEETPVIASEARAKQSANPKGKPKDPVKLSDDPNDFEEEFEETMGIWERVKEKLRSFFVSAPAKNGATKTVTDCCGDPLTITLASDTAWSDDALIRRIAGRKGQGSFDGELFIHTANTLIDGFGLGWHQNYVALAHSLGIEYDRDDPALLISFEQNLFRFSAGKTLAEVQELNELFRQSKGFEDFYRKAKARTDVFNKKWLQTEYASAVLSGQTSATYHRLIAKSETFPYWMYKTAGDHLVREEHAKINGLILPYNDPRWNQIYPPNGWNCRCYVVPRMKSEVDTSQNAAMKARADEFIASEMFARSKVQGWGVNKAKAGEVFTADQQYIRKHPGQASARIEKLGHADFGLMSYSQAKKAGTQPVPETVKTGREFFDALERVDGVPMIRDYAKRPLRVDPDNFESHTTDTVKNRQHRTEYLEAMSEALADPDETWLNGKELDNMVFVKYYQDKTIIAIGKIRNGRVELQTWFDLTEKASIIDRYRSGLLILSKNKTLL